MSITTGKTLITIANSILNFITTFIKYKLYKVENSKLEKEQISEALKNLDNACNSGTIADLLDATEKIGEIKK